MADIDRVILSWSRRNTTLMGRILIIKSLTLSMLVQYFISLPTHPKSLLNREFYLFLLKSKPPRIKAPVIEGETENGGVEMVDSDKFERTMKIKWINKVIKGNETWFNIPNKIGIKDLYTFGGDLHLTMVTNPYGCWLYKAFQKSFYCNDDMPNIEDYPLWYNSKVEIPYIWQWEKGLRRIKDLFNTEKGMQGRNTFPMEYSINFNFVDYTRIIKAIPKEYINRVFNLYSAPSSRNPWIQPHIKWSITNNKSSKNKLRINLLRKSPPFRQEESSG